MPKDAHLPLFFRRAWLMTKGLSYEAVALHPGPLTASEFLEYEMAFSLIALNGTKEGHEELRTRASARTILSYEEEDAIADLDEEDEAAADWEAEEREDDDDEADSRLGVSLRVAQARGGDARRVLLDGHRLGDSVFQKPELLLQLLPQDDPRAIYLRNGGRLDALGNPIDDDHAAAVGHGPVRTRAGFPTYYDPAQRSLPPEEAARRSELPASFRPPIYDGVHSPVPVAMPPSAAHTPPSAPSGMPPSPPSPPAPQMPPDAPKRPRGFSAHLSPHGSAGA